MCIAIVKKIEGRISDEAIKNSFAKNPHGAGFAYVDPAGHIVVRKGFFDVDSFIEAYRAAEKEHEDTTPFLLHFRWATAGPQTLENCHPFNYKHGAMMHNGHFYQTYGNKSDSREFAEEMGDFFSKEEVTTRMKAIEDTLGHNKVAMLFPDKTYAIVNEKTGLWEENVWYSNTSYLPPTPAGPNWDRRSGMPVPARYANARMDEEGWFGF